MTKRWLLLLFLPILLITGTSVYAVTSYQQDSFVLPAGTVHHGDLAFTGDSLEINGKVDGDVYSFGKHVSINGEITGDLITISMYTTVTGKVDGNIRAFSHRLIVDGEVGRNVTALAEKLLIPEKSRLAGNLLMLTHQSQVNGAIMGELNGSAKELAIEGQVGDSISSLYVSKLLISDSAVINGDVHYHSPQPASIAPDATITGQVTHTLEEAEQDVLPFSFSPLLTSMTLLTTLTLWLLIRYLFPHSLPRLSQTLEREWLLCTGVGALVFIAAPILLVVLIITIVGIPLGIIFGLIVGFLLYIGKIYLGSWLGSILRARYRWRIHIMWAELLGIIALFIAVHLPYIGWLIQFLIWFVFLGAVTRTMRPVKIK